MPVRQGMLVHTRHTLCLRHWLGGWSIDDRSLGACIVSVCSMPAIVHMDPLLPKSQNGFLS